MIGPIPYEDAQRIAACMSITCGREACGREIYGRLVHEVMPDPGEREAISSPQITFRCPCGYGELFLVELREDPEPPAYEPEDPES